MNKTRDLNSYIDHTFLNASGDEDAVLKLCEEAVKYGFASVCVNPSEVPLANAYKKNFGAELTICTVIGFPLGQSTADVKLFEALDAIRNGAEELDFVINVRLLKYYPEACAEELDYIIEKLNEKHPEVVTKLIIECCLLTDEEKVLACKMAKDAGFDFVKTSTGFSTGGARVEDVRLMRKTVGLLMGVKASGGIRTREDAEKMIAAGATRIGTSAGVKICS